MSRIATFDETKEALPWMTYEHYLYCLESIGGQFLYNDGTNPDPDTSYYRFFKFFWPEVMSDKLVDNFHIEKLCGVLQKAGEKIIEGKPATDILINMPPGEGKSSIVTVFWPVWLWIHRPSLKVLNTSHTNTLSKAHASLSRELIRTELFRRMYGKIVKISRTKDSSERYHTYRKGQRVAASVGTKVTGQHFHVLIGDDILDAQGTVSKADLRDAADHIEYLETRKAGADRSMALMVLVMQRVHDKDPAGVWLKEKGDDIEHICLPTTLDYPVKPLSWMKYYKNGYMNFKRTGPKVCSGFIKALGSIRYAAQFGQNTKAAAGNVIKRKHLEVINYKDVPPQVWSDGIVNFYCDPADKTGPHNDPTGQLACVYYGGTLYLLEYIWGRWSFNDRKKAMHDQYLRWASVNSVLYVEPKSSGASLIQALYDEPYSINAAEYEIPKGSKESRVYLCMGVIESLRVKLVSDDIAEVPLWNNHFIRECLAFPNSAHDEATDVLAMAITQEVLRSQSDFAGSFEYASMRDIFGGR